MFHSSPARWLAAFHAMAALAAVAQPAPEAAPATTVLPYRSAFEGYRSYGEDKPIPWRDANETVRKRGGWRAYAKEAAGADAGDPAARAKHEGPGTHQGHTMPMPANRGQP